MTPADHLAAEVLRILPRTNDAVNEEWLGDKSRFSVDGLKRRRLDKVWIREAGKLRSSSWEQAFAAIAARLKNVAGDRIGAISGDLCDAESMLALKDMMTALGSSNIDCRQDGAALDISRREFYLFNTTIAGIEEADALLIIGSNPRREAPVLNARIRKRTQAGKSVKKQRAERFRSTGGDACDASRSNEAGGGADQISPAGASIAQRDCCATQTVSLLKRMRQVAGLIAHG